MKSAQFNQWLDACVKASGTLSPSKHVSSTDFRKMWVTYRRPKQTGEEKAKMAEKMKHGLG